MPNCAHVIIRDHTLADVRVEEMFAPCRQFVTGNGGVFAKAPADAGLGQRYFPKLPLTRAIGSPLFPDTSRLDGYWPLVSKWR